MSLCLNKNDGKLKFSGAISPLKLVNVAIAPLVFGAVTTAISLSDYVNKPIAG
jgi:hypothetical protein